MITPVILISGLLLLYAGETLAGTPQICGENACISHAYLNAPQADLQQAPKLAWRPGIYNPENQRRSAVPRKGPENPQGTFIFNPKNRTWAAYDNRGDLVRSGYASGGMPYCADLGRSCRTPMGTFRVYAKGDESCVSSKYPLGQGGAPMPHCMFFHGGYAIHGSDYVPDYHASRGCVRVPPPVAEWLHRNFVRVGTVVVVKPY